MAARLFGVKADEDTVILDTAICAAAAPDYITVSLNPEECGG